MLAISPLSNCDIVERTGGGGDEFIGEDEFLGGPMLDFNFDNIFLDFDDKDVLPDLEVEPAEVDLGDFSFDCDAEPRVDAEGNIAAVSSSDDGRVEDVNNCENSSQENKEVVSSTKEEDSAVEVSTGNSPSPESDFKEEKKSSSVQRVSGKSSSHGKKKGKVDWTPELHRRFVQAVEQLGIDKAVPSRILEIMGIDGLTRHNIASHLQKYRSHRKHLLAREAEAASWTHRRQMYGHPKRDIGNPWLAPTVGFPPHHPPPPPHPMHHSFRPLHVWGHPFPAPSPPPHAWMPPPPPHPSPWLPHYPRGPNGLTQGTPCFPRPVQPPAMRFPHPPVPAVPPHPLYRPDATSVHHHPNNNKKLGSQLQLLDTLPSKESVDAAIGDVLAKPWLPLPLGLKPPSLDSVMVELQKKGVSKVPPPTSSS